MNRRNFILGLGTAATLSGAASVTSAAIQSQVEPGADFRIVAAEALNVRRNPDIEDGSNQNVSASLDGFVNETDNPNWTEGSGEGDLNFSADSPVYETSGPNMTIDSGDNGALNMSLATPNSNQSVQANRNSSYNGDLHYSGVDRTGTNTNNGEFILEVENVGATSQDVGVNYTYGADASANSGAISNSTINTLFTFVDSTGTVISPQGSDGTNAGNFTTIDSGNTENIGLILNYSDEIESELTNALESGFGGSASDADLLDVVAFGTDDGT